MEGLESGREKERILLIKAKIKKNKSLQTTADELESSLDDIRVIYGKLKEYLEVFPQASDDEIVEKVLGKEFNIMNNDMRLYYDYTISPLGKLFYNTVFSQLDWIKDKEVLDFGSGFGFTSNRLAKTNKVTSVEKEEIMITHSLKNEKYMQIHGDFSAIKGMASNSYDVVVCHLVLEFVDKPAEILNELIRVLKKDGILSIVKHNRNGRLIQAIVQDFDTKEAHNLLKGGDSFSSAFGDIKYYDNNDLIKWTNHNTTIQKTFGVRALASLHNSEIMMKENWLSEMFEVEKVLCENVDMIKIAYFNHIILRKI